MEARARGLPSLVSSAPFPVQGFTLPPMKIRLARILTLLCAVALAPVTTARWSTAAAQAVERPEAFDSAGRVMVVTPSIAARLELLPPAWRITGDYREARLFALGDESYVVVVQRRSGDVERYSITKEDRAYLRAKTSSLPPDLAEQLRTGFSDAVRGAREVAAAPSSRTAFVVNQTALGFLVYGPSFAAAVTNEDAGRIATYLLVSGGSFFAASAYAQAYGITPAQNRLASWGAVHGGLGGLGLTYGLGATNDGQAAGVFVGSLAGTVAGVYFGNELSLAEVQAANFGADALAIVALGVTGAMNGFESGSGISRRTSVATIAGAGLVGYPLGVMYPGRVRYNVTDGDVITLYASGGVGTLLGLAVAEATKAAGSGRLLGVGLGFAAGAVAGDPLLVRRFDHSFSQGLLVVLGGAMGSLMGAGVYALASDDRSNDAALATLAALGGAAGIMGAGYFSAPPDDARSGGQPAAPAAPRTSPTSVPPTSSSRLQFSPTAAALAAAGVPGRHPILSVRF